MLLVDDDQSKIVQRREKRADGFVFMGEVPDGEIDPAVGVMRVDDLNGKPIAVTCSYGCHTVVVGPRDLSASPDFPGAARDTIEQLMGGTALFLQALRCEGIAVRGVPLRPGAHTVVFTYRTPGLIVGAWTSAVAVVLALLVRR